MDYVLGIDLGTSSLKGVLVTKSGMVAAQKSCEYPLYAPKSGYKEQNPDDWIKAAEQVILELLSDVPDMKEGLAGISFSGQMHTLVLLDHHQKPLRPAILWNDVRTSKECNEIMAKSKKVMLGKAKNRALEGFTFPKLLWVKRNEPEIWEKAECFLMPKDYLRYYLTGKLCMEYSDAAGTVLLDIEKKEWLYDVIDDYGLNRDLFPQLTASTDMTGLLRYDLKKKFGFKQDVKVFAGGADNACAALGAGIIKPGSALCSIGTSGVFLSYEKAGDKDFQGKVHYFNHCKPDSCYAMGVTLAAGHSLSWFKDTFNSEMSYDNLLSKVDDIPPGSGGLLFTPYIVGERTPYADGNIRGSFIGIDASHTIDHFAKAVIEGITFSLKDSQDIMEETTGNKFDKIISVGGGAKNKAWLQMQADIFNAKIVTLESEQGPAMGAVMIAAYGCGWFETLEECCDAFVSYKDEYVPRTDYVEKYQKIYQIYQKVYGSTKEISNHLLSVRV